MSELVGKDGLPVVLFETEKNWADWLDQNSRTAGVWVRIPKKEAESNRLIIFRLLK